MLMAIGEVMSVIEMAVDEKDDREVHEVEKVVTKEWSKAKVLKLTFVFALAVEIIQDWVRCASGYVFI